MGHGAHTPKQLHSCKEGDDVSDQAKTTMPIFILAGTSQQYTDARRKLALVPSQAYWLTRPSNLAGKIRPKVYRFGDWKSLTKLQEIEAALVAAEADVTDLS